MKLLDRYFLRESLIPLAIGSGAVTMMLIGTLLFNFAQWFFSYQVPFVAILQMVLYYAPSVMVLSLPVGTAVAVSLTVNRLTRDSELTVMRMAGVSLRRLFRPLLLLGLLMSLLNFTLNEYVVPPSMQAFYKLQNKMFAMNPALPITSNRVVSVDRYSIVIGSARQTGSQVILEDILLFEREREGNWTLIKAENGFYEEGLWTLFKPTVHRYQKDGTVWDVKVKDRVQINLRAAIEDIFSSYRPEEMTRQQLLEKIKNDRQMGASALSDEVLYHMKLSIPAACLILALCSPVLSMRFARAGTFMGVLLSIILTFICWNTLLLFQILGNQGILPPLAAAWATNLLFGTAGLILLWRSE